jgi:hypothetical protein
MLTEDEVRIEHLDSQASSFDKKTSSKKLYLKATKLNPDLLAYLRAHLLLRYESDLTKLKVSEPTDVEYELLILEAYQEFL